MFRCCSGTGNAARPAQNRSPKTPLVIHALSSGAGPNARGLIQIHRSASAIGTTDHQPSQVRLQTASTRSGRQVVNRVQPLHGFAWRAQPWSSRPKALAMCFSAVMCTTARFRTLRENWSFLREKALTLPPAEAAALFDELSADIRSLVVGVGDSSNLILDPHLESYYLMDAVVVKLPEFTEIAVRARRTGLSGPSAAAPDAAGNAVLASLAGRLDAVRRSVREGLATSFAADPQGRLKASLGKPSSDWSAAADRLHALIDARMRDGGRLTDAEYANAADAALDAGFDLWDRTAAELDAVLHRRIDRIDADMRWVQAAAAAGLAVAAWLFLAFYLAVMRTVRSLRDAAARMSGGDAGADAGEVALHTRDETADVVRSFNEVAARLRREWAQARDESARARAAEGALRVAEAKFRGIVENAHEGIFQTSPDGRYLSVNPALARIYGYADVDDMLRNVADVARQVYVDPARRDEFVALMARDGRVAGFEAEVRRRDGAVIWISENARAVRDEQGRVLHYEGTVQDITARKQAEARILEARDAAERANQAKGAFLANMSHEIRTPMNAVIGMTGLLLDTPLNAEQREFASTIRTSADALLTVINDILDFSKIESGNLELETEPFDLRECVEGSMELLATRAAEKGLDLAYNFEPGAPEAVRGDSTRLRQILVNLVGNAVKFTERGEVTVTVAGRPAPGSEGDVEVHFAVRDTGIGIPPERMDRLFKPFSQADAATTRRFGGTGLGLVISRRFAEAMGGRMWVESELGRGTTFHFTMVVPPAPPPARRYDGGEHPELRNRRVLIVDDNATNRRLLRLRLESWGMTVEDTEFPREALARLDRGDRFDAAVLDIQMPEMDGVTLAREIRRRPATAALPLVAFTSLGRREPGAEAVGFAAYLNKPLKASQMYDTLMGVFAAAPVAVSAPAAGPEYDPALGDRLGLRILLADDVAVNQRLVLLMLGKMGMRADVAGNGKEAVEAVLRQPYDVVLMDVHMPEVDGLEATRRIRAAVPEGLRPRIVALTAGAMEQDRRRCVEAGMDDFLSKPVKAAELQEALKRCRRLDASSPAPVPDGAGDEPTRPAPAGGDGPADDVLDPAILEDLRSLDTPGEPGVLAGLVEGFRADGPPLLAAVASAAAENRADDLAKSAHRLRGLAANLGARRVAAAAAELESAGKQGITAGLDGTITSLRQEFDRACRAYAALGGGS